MHSCLFSAFSYYKIVNIILNEQFKNWLQDLLGTRFSRKNKDSKFFDYWNIEWVERFNTSDLIVKIGNFWSFIYVITKAFIQVVYTGTPRCESRSSCK